MHGELIRKANALSNGNITNRLGSAPHNKSSTTLSPVQSPTAFPAHCTVFTANVQNLREINPPENLEMCPCSFWESTADHSQSLW